ncbi:HNH endonuclease [Streptomyces violascens]|uniref:HNH endonuclease n=1 Tax=Streptomyces violascens TaxID=67381 RepID=UPI0036A612DD
MLSPALSNIYLDRLDKYIESHLPPAHNRGKQRQFNRTYMRLRDAARYQEKIGNRETARRLWQQMQQLPSRDPNDPGFRRLHYCRYADDWLLGFTGPKREAETIKADIGEFLHSELKLELSPTKTLITHGRTQPARFLGYEITVFHSDTKHSRHGWRSINAQIELKVPQGVANTKARLYLRRGKPIHRTERMTDSDFSIIAQYQAEYRGVVNYYQLAINRHPFEWLKYVMQCSLTKTLAHKYRISVPEVYRRYRAVLATDRGPRAGLRVTIERGNDRKPLVAEWGGISLARKIRVHTLDDQPPKVWNNQRSELVQRLLAESCELCGSARNVEVHHVRHLKDLRRKGRAPMPAWAERMASRQRKTLVVCRNCHHAIHNGRPTGQNTQSTTLESRVRS